MITSDASCNEDITLGRNSTGVNDRGLEQLGKTFSLAGNDLEFDASIEVRGPYRSDDVHAIYKPSNFDAFPVTAEIVADDDPYRTTILLEIQQIKNLIVMLMEKVDELRRKSLELDPSQQSSKAKFKKTTRSQEKELSEEQLNNKIECFKQDLKDLRAKLQK